VHPLGATNPEDIEFRARVVKDTHAYHMGESIELEIVHSSQSEKKYQRNSTSSLENVNLQLTPSVKSVPCTNAMNGYRWQLQDFRMLASAFRVQTVKESANILEQLERELRFDRPYAKFSGRMKGASVIIN